MRKITKIYLDMDGVIADFDHAYVTRFGISPPEADRTKEFYKHFDIFIAERDFANLQMIQGAKELIDYLRALNIPTEILSSTSSEKRHAPIAEQKTEWLQKHGIDFKINLVPGKRFKKDFSNENSILIDDTTQNIDQWRENGGIGILHTDAITTIDILKMYA
jgi:phosphoglycolate phosphatase-like HAD superfamily hydrolase